VRSQPLACVCVCAFVAPGLHMCMQACTVLVRSQPLACAFACVCACTWLVCWQPLACASAYVQSRFAILEVGLCSLLN